VYALVMVSLEPWLHS